MLENKGSRFVLKSPHPLKFAVDILACFVSADYRRTGDPALYGVIPRLGLPAHPVEDIGYAALTYFHAVKVFENGGKAFERDKLQGTQTGR